MFVRLAWMSCIASLVAAGGWACRPRSEAMHSPALTVTSPAFAEGQTIPRKYTGEGEDVSPPLAFAGVPPQAVELALVCADPDAPVGTWYHWVLYGLKPQTSSLPEGLPREPVLTHPIAARQGRTIRGPATTSAIAARCRRGAMAGIATSSRCMPWTSR
jgi:phosphatidylethanolamine-binding protein (PEBP) family uncharacterized protein